MTAEAVNEVLRTGDVIVDGDVRFAGDFSHDDLSDPNPEQIHANDVLRVIAAWESAEGYKALKRLGAKHPAVRRQGGLAGCDMKSKELELEARRIFLITHDFPPDEPNLDYEAEVDDYYEGVRAWATFRSEISNPDVRLQIKTVLENKIPSAYREAEG